MVRVFYNDELVGEKSVDEYYDEAVNKRQAYEIIINLLFAGRFLDNTFASGSVFNYVLVNKGG